MNMYIYIYLTICLFIFVYGLISRNICFEGSTWAHSQKSAALYIVL